MFKNLPLYVISGMIGIIAFYAGFTGKKVLFVSGPRTAVITLTIVGFMMCTAGAIGAFVTKAPAHPLTIAGYILGALALITGVIQIFRLKVPFLSDPYHALVFITVVIFIKFLIARLNFLLPVK